ENLGLVNIYFRDLGVKETAQERAYDFFSFLCDVGGSIGLWLGASMLSLVELLDLCLYPRLRRDYARIVHGELLRRFGAKGDEPVDSVLVKSSGNGPSSFKTALVNPRNGIGGSVPYLSDDDDNVSQAHLLLPRKGSKYLRLNGQDDYWEDRSYTNSVYYDALESLSQLRSNDSDTLYSVSDDRDSILG
uniref:Uncharacterized protein n=1 Tax=Romanomermis culicivorax TaxID=13658 RepID=A0A915J4W7_ROMCU